MSEFLKAQIIETETLRLADAALDETKDSHWTKSWAGKQVAGMTIWVETKIEWIGHRVIRWEQTWGSFEAC